MAIDSYVVGFMGKSTVGKSRMISTCIADKEIAKFIHADNVKGKSKTNVVYKINTEIDDSYQLIPKTSFLRNSFLVKKNDNGDSIFDIDTFTKDFAEISQENDFEGIEKFKDIFINKKNSEELTEWIKNYIKKILGKLSDSPEIQNCKTITDEILYYYRLFEKHLSYNNLFDIHVELKASDKFKLVLLDYSLDSITLIDTRGIFDSPDIIKRSFTKYSPDINIFIFDEKGVTEHLFNQIFEELKPMFGKSFEICLRTTTSLQAQIASIENCINPTKNLVLSKKFDTIISFLKDKNVLEGNTIFDIRLRKQLGSVLPEIPNKDDYGLSDEEFQEINNKYDDIVCKLFKKIIDLKKKEEAAIEQISQKCKNPTYKDSLVNSVVCGTNNALWDKYTRRCAKAVLGKGTHLSPTPQIGKIQSHISDLFFTDTASDWIFDEYICNIVTYEAANLINDAIEDVRNNRPKLSDIELSEYLFILKNTLAHCQNALYEWSSYVFWSLGYRMRRIPKIYYEKSCKNTIGFSKKGTIYYKTYDNIEIPDYAKEYASALMNSIIEAVRILLQEKLSIDIIVKNTETKTV